MRVAVFSDCHGNAIALEAVLADIEAGGGVDAHWMIGDVADMGSDPARCIALLRGLENAAVVRGNADRAVYDIDLAGEFAGIRAASDEEALTALMYLAGAAWTRGAITQADAAHLRWLEGLPLESRQTLPDGTRVLLVHAAPGRDDGPGPLPSDSDVTLRSMLAGCEADLVFTGHTHTPLDRTVDGIRLVNTGSVSNPVTDDRRAMWTLLDADHSGYRLERRFVDYDRAWYLHELGSLQHPAESKIRAFFTGDASP